MTWVGTRPVGHRWAPPSNALSYLSPQTSLLKASLYVPSHVGVHTLHARAQNFSHNSAGFLARSWGSLFQPDGQYSRLLWLTVSGDWGWTICCACLLLFEAPGGGYRCPQGQDGQQQQQPGPRTPEHLWRRWGNLPLKFGSLRNLRGGVPFQYRLESQGWEDGEREG